MTALSQKNLEEQKIESGADSMSAVPNLTFSKTNFSSYNVSIRGIGTKANSATTEPGVADSCNKIGDINNRCVEKELLEREGKEGRGGGEGRRKGGKGKGG